MRQRGLDMPPGDPERRRVPHATAGQLVLRAWLVKGWERRQAEPYVVVVGGHHGVPPTYQDLIAAQDRSRLLGWGPGQRLWRDVQTELLDRAARAHGALEWLEEWRTVALPQPVQVLASAVVIVADWIASNDELFPYDNADERTAARLDDAWSALALPAPWRSTAVSGPAESLLAARFGFGQVQVKAVHLAGSLSEPGLLVIEAPMGRGKTEAALAAAEVLAAARCGWLLGGAADTRDQRRHVQPGAGVARAPAGRRPRPHDALGAAGARQGPLQRGLPGAGSAGCAPLWRSTSVTATGISRRTSGSLAGRRAGCRRLWWGPSTRCCSPG